MAKRYIPDLIVETPQISTSDFAFLSVIEYLQTKYLVIIDNMIDNMIYAYVLDEAIQRKMNLEVLLPKIAVWAENPIEPLSFLFARLGVANETSLIYRSFEVTGVTRLIGSSYKFNMAPSSKIKRRRIIERIELQSVAVNQDKFKLA
jgi:hypothetical protein